jgi:hypothetical protein
VELVATLAVATKQNKQGRQSESFFGEVLYYLTECTAENFAKKLFGEKDINAVLQRLDRLTQEEARITAGQTLEVVHGLLQNTRVSMDGERSTTLISCQLLSILP